MATHAVDQDEGLVRGEAAQGGRAHAVGAVGDGRAREGEGGGDSRQCGGHFRRALAGQGLCGDDVDRCQGLEARAAFGPGAGDDEFLDFAGWGGRLGGASQKRDSGHGRKQEGARVHGYLPGK